MPIIQILVLAVAQGACELLPVSSSAHITVAERLMRLDPTATEMTFLLVMLHTGTMFAVIVYFWTAWRNRDFGSARAFWGAANLITLATVLTGAFGLERTDGSYLGDNVAAARRRSNSYERWGFWPLQRRCYEDQDQTQAARERGLPNTRTGVHMKTGLMRIMTMMTTSKATDAWLDQPLDARHAPVDPRSIGRPERYRYVRQSSASPACRHVESTSAPRGARHRSSDDDSTPD